MPCNIEIKAVLKDRAGAEATAARLSDSGPQIIHQEDIFFKTDAARLKLRILGPNRGELIRYERDDVATTRLSRYSIARTTDPKVLLEILQKSLGIMGVVRKKRTLYMVSQTRIHLDEVEGLGDFLELEVVLRDGQNEEEGMRIADGLLAEFGVSEGDLVAEAYVDLLARSAQVP